MWSSARCKRTLTSITKKLQRRAFPGICHFLSEALECHYLFEHAQRSLSELIVIRVPVVEPNVRLKTVYPSSIPVDGIELEEVIALLYCQSQAPPLPNP